MGRLKLRWFCTHLNYWRCLLLDRLLRRSLHKGIISRRLRSKQIGFRLLLRRRCKEILLWSKHILLSIVYRKPREILLLFSSCRHVSFSFLYGCKWFKISCRLFNHNFWSRLLDISKYTLIFCTRLKLTIIYYSFLYFRCLSTFLL